MQGLPGQATVNQISRWRDGQHLGASDQQLFPATDSDTNLLWSLLAGGNVLQMDKAESPHQDFL
jgi:hypothetical protein